MLIGIDDTDSLSGMCTTYIAKKICDEIKIEGYPRLVRLNPNIPFKTRGNGAIALKTKEEWERVRRVVTQIVREFSRVEDKRTNPGVVFVSESSANTKILTSFYSRVVSQLVSIREAEEIAKKIGAQVFRLNNGRGIVGALAALGFNKKEKTYELIAYRVPKNYGRKRLIDSESVFRMNEKFYPKVFDSIDAEKRKVLIAPHGKDPVFCGIRGKSPEYVSGAWKMVKPLEEIESTIVFETNQATDDHLRKKKISQVRPYDCAMVEGVIGSVPKVIEGGHVVFALSDESGRIDCAAYQQTGCFRGVVSGLLPGDVVVACGGIGRYVGTLNLEKLFVVGLIEVSEFVVPKCCGKKMTSAGKNKGFKCRKCHKKVSQTEIKSRKLSRKLKKGGYEVPPRARRHLSKPLALV